MPCPHPATTSRNNTEYQRPIHEWAAFLARGQEWTRAPLTGTGRMSDDR